MDELDPVASCANHLVSGGMFDGWRVAHEPSAAWTEYSPLRSSASLASVEAGFKVHVSSSIASASEVLHRVLPVLARRRTPFKHASTVAHLVALSSGRGGATQIGKFVTAYPSDSAAARETAWELHEVTADLPGPAIPNEVPVVEGSLVHFRYGAFGEQWMQLPTGRITRSRKGQGGRAEPDDRRFASAVTDAPYDEGALAAIVEPRVVGSHYVRAQQMHSSPKSSSWIGFSLQAASEDLVVIKSANAYVMEGHDGTDATSWLKHEAEILRELEDCGVTPRFIDQWDEPRRSFLVYELVEGLTLAEAIRSLSAEGLPHPSSPILQAWSEDLCKVVSILHGAGYVIGDLKPSNVVLTSSGFRLIDLELAIRPTSRPIGGAGTPGYASPQQLEPDSGRTYADDIYSFGATMLSAAILTDLGTIPDPWVAAKREVQDHPGRGLSWAMLKCLDPSPAERFQNVDDLRTALNAAPQRPSIPVAASNDPHDFNDASLWIADDLLQSAVREADYSYWRSCHPIQQEQAGRDLYAGSSGVALSLCAAYENTLEARYLDEALRCGRWLRDTSPAYTSQLAMPGLYFGGSGPGMLFLKLHQLSDEDVWLECAGDVARQVARMPSHSPDLLTGDAGVLLFLIAAWRRLRNREILNDAALVVDHLTATRDSDGFMWQIPAGHDDLSGQRYLGFSHGSAGIGYALAEYSDATQDPDALAWCGKQAQWLVNLGARLRPDREDSLVWPMTTAPESEPCPAYWCHGSAGIARYLARVAEVTGKEELLDAAERAGTAVARLSAWRGTTQCHGLAGNAEVMIDLWSCTGRKEWLDRSLRMGSNLLAYRGASGWPAEQRSLFAPDLLVGQAGIGAAFLRLANPASPHILAVANFGDGERLDGDGQVKFTARRTHDAKLRQA